MKKIKILLMICLLCISCLFNFVFAYTNNLEMASIPGGLVDPNPYEYDAVHDAGITVTDPGMSDGMVISGIKEKTKDVWATVVFVVQILAVGCIVFAGLRYMFASADQKADIKQGLIYLTIGAVLVFGATLIIQLVAEAAEQIA